MTAAPIRALLFGPRLPPQGRAVVVEPRNRAFWLRAEDGHEEEVPYVWVRPTDRIWLNVNTECLMSFGEFDQTIVAARWDVTDQDSLAARYVLSDGQQFFRLAFARQTRKGLDIFSVYEAGALMKPSLSAKFVMSFP